MGEKGVMPSSFVGEGDSRRYCQNKLKTPPRKGEAVIIVVGII